MMSEYVASVVYEQLKLPVQQVELITWKNQPAVLIADFLPSEHYFVPFGSLIEEKFDTNGDTAYSYENIKEIVLTHPAVTDREAVLAHFWNMFLVDFLIGGGGRNASNWGFIGYKGKLSPAPVFDSSSSFYYKDYHGETFSPPGTATPPRMTFQGKTKERIDVIRSGLYPECTYSAKYLLNHFSLETVAEQLYSSEMDNKMIERWFLPILQYNFLQLQEVK